MATYPVDEISGYNVGEETVCPNCIQPAEMSEITADEVILDKEDNDFISFCDRCKKQM